MELRIPIAERFPSGLKLAPRLRTLQGKTVGFIHNGWWSLGVVFDSLEIALKEREGVTRVVRQMKTPTLPVPRASLEALAHSCDAVVTGLGN